jgi:hypothetical protein
LLTIAMLAGYAAMLALVLRLLASSRGREEEATRAFERFAATAPRANAVAAAPPVRAVAVSPPLEQLAEDVHDALAVDRVTVVVSDDEKPGVGRVRACFGSPKPLDSRINLIPVPVTGPMSPFGAAALGIGDADERADSWTFAHVPITGAGELLGAVTVATCGERDFTEDDLTVVERLARSRVPRFDRRRRVTIPRALT